MSGTATGYYMDDVERLTRPVHCWPVAPFEERKGRRVSQAPLLSPVEEVADFFARSPSREEIARCQLSDAAQEQISQLLDKEDDGALAADEQRQLDELVPPNDRVTLIRSRVLDTPDQNRVRWEGRAR